MRTTKFRAKLLEENSWVYGGGAWTFDNGVTLFFGEDGEGKPVIHKIQVDTLGQSTGLHDRWGEEIYDGDCIMARDIYGEYIGSVEWWNDRWTLAYKGKFDSTKQNQSLMTVQFPEVIGNIWDHPHLLTNHSTKE